MADIRQLHEAREKTRAIAVEGGGGPPHNGDMDARLAKLEAIIPTLATKEEVVKLRGETREGFAEVRAAIEGARTDMHKNTAEIIKWMVGLTFGLGATAIVVMTFVLNNATPKAPAAPSQPPIIINVPAQPQPVKP